MSDADGPIIGAGVFEKGNSGNGTVTDGDGRYTIGVSSGAVLVVSYLGYATQEVAVGGRTSINITLAESAEVLEEVVVVGYGTQKKTTVTGSVSAITSKQLTVVPVANVSNALVGKLPGLVAKQNSGLPGSDGSSLSIRGFGNPLVIVDGIEGSFTNIDPEQIESVSILKDGAASIYGARAGNGVLLVTTKRGNIQKPTITFNSAYTMQGVTDMVKPASSGQMSRMLREEHLQSGKPEADVPYTEEEVMKYFAGNDPAYPDTDWYNAIFRDRAPEQNYNLSIRGGNERIKYMGYFGYLNQETIIKKNGGNFSRYNVQSNMDALITQNLSLSVDLLLAYENRDFPNRGAGNGGYMWQDYYNTRPWYPAYLPDPSKIAYGGLDIGSIIATSNMDISGYEKTRNRDLRGAIALTYEFPFIQGLKAKAFVNYRDNDTYGKSFRKPFSFWTYNYATEQYTKAGDYYTSATLTERISRSNVLTQQYSLAYENLFNKAHRVSALVLFESMDYNDNNFSAFREGFITPLIEQLSGGSTTGMSNDGGAGEMGRAGFVGRFNYGYKDKYLLEAILRADASAKFPQATRWGYFPGISAGWVISSEGFMENLSFPDNLKLRGSYGRSGNDGVGNFQYLSGYTLRPGTYLLGDKSVSGLYNTNLANPLLTWENMTVYNGGIDFSFLQRKIYGTAEGFYRLREGIPGTRSASLPSTFGASLPQENLNSIDDRGFDLSLGSAYQAGEFYYDVSANISRSRAKYVRYDEPEFEDPDQERISRRTGQWTDRRMGYVYEKLFTDRAEIDNLPYVYSSLGDNSSLRPGDVKYKDVNEDGFLDWKDQVEIGQGVTPHWMYGISGTFACKGFDLTLLFQGAFGYNTNMNLGFQTITKYNLRWTEATNDPYAQIPRLGGAASNEYPSAYHYRKTSYIRLKNASLGYTLPQRITGKAGMERVRFYLGGTNLMTFSSISDFNLDPEAPDINNKVMYYPQQRTVSFGLNLSF